MKYSYRFQSSQLVFLAVVLCLCAAVIAAASTTHDKNSHTKKPIVKKGSSYEDITKVTSSSKSTPTTTTITDSSTNVPQELIANSQNYDELVKLMSLKRKECKNISKNSTTTSTTNNKKAVANFFCKRLKWNTWLLQQLNQNTTRIIPKFIKLVKNSELSDTLQDDSESYTPPENWGEKVAFSLIEKYGEPVDKLLFYQFKKYTKSRELQVSIPQLVKIRILPRTHLEGSTGRTLFDPGFNLKLKFPFFKDELKVAVSTGPSFLAGLGVGLVVLGIKSLFSPLILAVKYYILSFFFKHLSPFDFLKAITGHILPFGWKEPPEEPIGWIEEDGGS